MSLIGGGRVYRFWRKDDGNKGPTWRGEACDERCGSLGWKKRGLAGLIKYPERRAASCLEQQPVTYLGSCWVSDQFDKALDDVDGMVP
jgi:hypothetical protein